MPGACSRAPPAAPSAQRRAVRSGCHRWWQAALLHWLLVRLRRVWRRWVLALAPVLVQVLPFSSQSSELWLWLWQWWPGQRLWQWP